jgi:hypothetical protein
MVLVERDTGLPLDIVIFINSFSSDETIIYVCEIKDVCLRFCFVVVAFVASPLILPIL